MDPALRRFIIHYGKAGTMARNVLRLMVDSVIYSRSLINSKKE